MTGFWDGPITLEKQKEERKLCNLTGCIKGAMSRFAHFEKFSLNYQIPFS